MNEGGWRRLHPVSPLVRAGRGLAALLILFVPALVGRGSASASTVPLAIVGIAAVLGYASWLVTRWRLDGDDLRIESGIVRRQSLRFPLAQVQAIDIVRPGLARLLGVAELRLRMAGSTGEHARLAYLTLPEAERLRVELLARAGSGAAASRPSAEHEQVLVSVPSLRLAESIILSVEGLTAVGVLVGLGVAAELAPGTVSAVAGGGAAWIVAVPLLLWRRFNQDFRLTVAETADGLRLRSGLIATNAETIRPGRVQAVRMVEPLVWRALGWCRLEVDIAGRQRAGGENAPERRALRAVLPVGSREAALALLGRILPAIPAGQAPPPRRVRIKSPLRYRFLAWGRSDETVVATSGRVRRVTVWVPLAKVQSLRRTQGPVQRSLRLATIHLDTAGRSVHAALRDRDAAEADAALAELIVLCADARRAASSAAPRRPLRAAGTAPPPGPPDAPGVTAP